MQQLLIESVGGAGGQHIRLPYLSGRSFATDIHSLTTDYCGAPLEFLGQSVSQLVDRGRPPGVLGSSPTALVCTCALKVSEVSVGFSMCGIRLAAWLCLSH